MNPVSCRLLCSGGTNSSVHHILLQKRVEQQEYTKKNILEGVHSTGFPLIASTGTCWPSGVQDCSVFELSSILSWVPRRLIQSCKDLPRQSRTSFSDSVVDSGHSVDLL